MEFRDHIYHLTPEGGEKLIIETREQMDAAKSKLKYLESQKAKMLKKYNYAIDEIKNEIRGCESIITMVEQTVFGNTDITDAELQAILNDPDIPF